METLSSPQRRKHFMDKGSKYKAMKSTKGAHGGGVSYEQQVNESEFETHDAYTKDKKEPGDKTTPALNKDAQYNEGKKRDNPLAETARRVWAALHSCPS